jgi:hypothetical protein
MKANHQTGIRVTEAAPFGPVPCIWLREEASSEFYWLNPLKQDPTSWVTRGGSDLYLAEVSTTLVGGDCERRGVRLSKLRASASCSADRTVLHHTMERASNADGKLLPFWEVGGLGDRSRR